MELKLCEGGCSRSFLRPVPVSARVGKKVCDACLALRPEQREQQYERQAILEANAKRGVFSV
jgi:hypothetical protein